MTVKKKIKPDAALKDFWRDRERFADLFNGTLFGGEKVLDPRILQEADTDMSTVIKTDDQAETVEHFPDVVKKSMNGVDFMLLGLENQMKIHYAMPLRNLTGETLAYLKEYREKAKKNRAEDCEKKTVCIRQYHYVCIMEKRNGTARRRSGRCWIWKDCPHS